MNFIILFLLCVQLWNQSNAASYNFLEDRIERFKRADCNSKYGTWSDWTKCTKDCGYCGTQTRTRTCAPVSGCSTPICEGEPSETQECGSNSTVCFWPIPSCCSSKYRKIVDVAGRQVYCTLKTDTDPKATGVKTATLLPPTSETSKTEDETPIKSSASVPETTVSFSQDSGSTFAPTSESVTLGSVTTN